MRPWLRWGLIGISGIVTMAVTMTREDIPTALRLLAQEGPNLPILIVLRRVESGYTLQLPSFTFWLVAAAIMAAITVVWRFRRDSAAPAH
jgi:hypothetical protein